MNDLRDKKSTGTLKFFQKIFVAYGLIFGGFWLKFDYIFHLEMNIPLFIITSIITIALTLIILIYNHKNEVVTSNKYICNFIALFVVGVIVYRAFNLFV